MLQWLRRFDVNTGREVFMDQGIFMGFVIGLVIGAIVLVILGFILQWLWNSTLPDVIGVNTITTWQAIKIMFIASILFGGHRVVNPPDPVAAGVDVPAAEAARG
jgi:TctA family transporter